MKPPIIPRWLKYSTANKYSDISTRQLQELVRDELIRSSLVKKPGATRGVRLIDRHSLDEFIESGVEGRCELAMNKERKGGRR